MASAVASLKDESYLNWCRGSLALLFLKECLEEFTDKRVSDFHDDLHTKVPQPYSRNGPKDPLHSQQQHSACVQICKTCTHNEVQRHSHTWKVKCLSKVCSMWLTHIIKHHDNNNIERTNLKPQLWPSHPWEVAKCFLPYGCENVTSAKDTDVAAILKLLKTCLFMSNFINNATLVDEVLDIRNRLMHSRTLSLSDDQLQHDTDKMIGLLNSLEDLSPTETQTIKATIDRIHKLQSKVMDVTANKEVSVLNSMVQGVQKELLSLKDKNRDYDKLRLDLKSTSDELEVIDQDYKTIEADIHQLKEAKRKFEDFLQKNDLMQNIDRLSIEIQDIGQRCEQQDQRVDIQEQRLEHHIQHIGHSIVQQDQITDKHFQRLDDHDQLIDKQTMRIDSQDSRIRTLEEHVKAKSDVSATENCRSWDEQCNDLQQYLQDLYWNICLWKNPITNEEEDFLQMYVNPSVKLIREKGEHGWLKTVREQRSQSYKLSYQTLFYSTSGTPKNIYVTGDVGTGKTMLCNNLVLTWCKAVQTSQDGTVSPEDRTLLSSFKFLFYIHLRDTGATYHIEDMIKEQLLYKTSISLDVSKILKTEKCLVVLDGLDEWLCPDGVQKCPGVNRDIPGRSITNKTCFFLTTTRSWKFDTIDLKTKDIDKHIELCGIGEDASKELVEKMSDYLDGKSQTGRNVDDFYAEINKKRLDNLITLPLILIQLITLWHYGKDLGNSQLQSYCNMLDLLFEHSVKNLTRQPTKYRTKQATNQRKLPACFNTKVHCENQSELIHCLAKLAYETLFNSKKEEALVFKSPNPDIFGISPSEVELCLQCGILSQNKDYRYYTGRYKKFSFLHKKIQEFLASLHIVTVDLVDTIIEDLKAFSDSLAIMLEMSQVWMFVAGIRPDITRHILTHLTEVAATDKQVHNYRQTLDGEELIRDILKCVNDCGTEGHSNGHMYDLNSLEDFCITESNIYYVEKQFMSTPASNIKSVYINSENLHDNQLLSIANKLQQCSSLQKIHLHDPECHIPINTVLELIKSTCDTLLCIDLYRETLEDELITAISNSHSLLAFGLALVQPPTRSKRDRIINSIAKRATIKELRLALPCSPSDQQLRSRIDLVSMSQLQTVGLWCMSVVNLKALSQYAKTVRLEHTVLTVTDFCEFVLAISKARRDVYVRLHNVMFTVSSDWNIDLKSFLKCCNGVVILNCNYETNNTWSVIFYTGNQ